MAKTALTLETAAPMPGGVRATADIHLALRGVSHTYPARVAQGPVPALGPLDFEFRRGEFFGVVGPSGCGKSTLLEIIAGLVTPTSGTIEMEGRAITGTVADEIGVVFQEDATFAWLNVWDNVAFGLRRAGLDGAEIVRRVDQALAFMGLSPVFAAPIRRNCPAACASASASHARWCSVRVLFSLTSRLAPSINRRAC
ncbi:MAG: NitT/TauT family transport system ATP-binding protein [Alphaproteobacteria bacterium]|nr:NitT/TauT family transport system ATP-binding protein [Alphaproteobacteria bacterium]